MQVRRRKTGVVWEVSEGYYNKYKKDFELLLTDPIKPPPSTRKEKRKKETDE